MSGNSVLGTEMWGGYRQRVAVQRSLGVREFKGQHKYFTLKYYLTLSKLIELMTQKQYIQ
jgi:hypothetical protein